MLFDHIINRKKKKHSWKGKAFVVGFIHRNSNPEMFSQKGVLKNFTKLTPVPESLFNKVTGLSCFFIHSGDVTYLFSDN